MGDDGKECASGKRRGHGKRRKSRKRHRSRSPSPSSSSSRLSCRETKPRKHTGCSNNNKDSSNHDVDSLARDQKRKKKKRHRERRRSRQDDNYFSSSNRKRSRREKRQQKKRKKNDTSKFENSSEHTVESNQIGSIAMKPPPQPEALPPQTPQESKVADAKRAMVPMSRQEYEKQQSQIRQVYDKESGRMRLIRGTGEVIESIVSRSQHAAINQQATRGDGSTFAKSIFNAASGRR